MCFNVFQGMLNPFNRDTVAAVGLRHQTLPLVVGSCDHICFIRHALTLDERRASFLPLPIGNTQADSSRSCEKRPSHDAHIKEVWFAGTHSEVYDICFVLYFCNSSGLTPLSGGGSRLNVDLDSGNISLNWMRQEAQLAGLRISTPDLRLRLIDLEGIPEDSLKGRWKPLQFFLVGRPKRQVQLNHTIHVSVLFKNAEYKPRAKIPTGSQLQLLDPSWRLEWGDEHSLSEIAKLDNSDWEKGLFDHAVADVMLEHLKDGKQLEFVHYLAFLARSGEIVFFRPPVPRS
jgi:hypothetical protein